MSSNVVNHRDGSRTVTYSDGHKVTFGVRKRLPKGRITGTPYVFASGWKITLPSGVAHGMIFEENGKLYVAMRYGGKDRLGRTVHTNYGQPITLTRPL